MMSEDNRIVCWVSCGVASVCAAMLTQKEYGATHKIRYVYNPVKEEHHDNLRYLKEVGEYIGVNIEIANNMAFPDGSAETVWRKRKFMSGPDGAPCTELLKKEARRQWEDLNSFGGFHVFGFTVEEKHRHARRAADGMKLIPILIDRGMTKQDCFDMMRKTNLAPPEIYSIGSRFGSGYPNANCIGCVKATSPTYWNHVRETFPDIFQQRAQLSREIGCKLVRCHPKYLSFCSLRADGFWYDDRTNECLNNNNGKLESPRIYLDELPPDAKGRSMKHMKIDCGISCGKES